MEEQYGMGDLRQFMNTGRSSSIFPPIPPPPELLSGHHRTLTPSNHLHQYDMVMGLGRNPPHLHDMGLNPGGLHHLHHHNHQQQLDLIRSDSTANCDTSTAASTVPCGGGGSGLDGAGVGISISFMSGTGCGGLEMDGVGLGMGDGGNGRWPRQETLTLLEIRSRLDSKFKEANQKGPLWDEVSRIMSEEHGYQRSGKKCREKFENLYKYYKKTKEGKAGRQDGKHYRFFRQLEALYGESRNNNASASASASGSHHHLRYNNVANSTSHIQEGAPFQSQKLSDNNSLSLSNYNSSEFDSTSSEDCDLNDSIEKRKKRNGKRSWKAKIRDLIDSQMRKLIEKQEAWMETIINKIEQKEQDRLIREEEWRKQEVARVDKEHKFWAHERSWIESRNAAMMEALRTLSSGKEVVKSALLLPDDQENLVAELQSMTKNQNDNGSHETINSIIRDDGWPESEITRLIQLRTTMEGRFHQVSCQEEILWEEIATQMACFGYDRTPLMCKEKWDSISRYLLKCSKKRKENSRFGCHLANESVTSHAIDQGMLDHQPVRQAQNNDQVANSPPPNHDSGNNVIHDGSSYRFVMDAENLWENYGIKFSKGNN